MTQTGVDEVIACQTKTLPDCQKQEKRICNKCKPNCDKCKMKQQNPLVLCKYVQPEVRQSLKPYSCFEKTKAKMTDTSIYRDSFVANPIQTCERTHPPNSLKFGEGKMSGDTVNRLTYTYVTNANPSKLFYPCTRNLFGVGPIESSTTHQLDYVPKTVPKTKSFAPEPVEHCLKPLSDVTTNRASYTPIDLSQVKTVSFRPLLCVTPSVKTDYNTVNRMSFQPCASELVEKPWADQKEYVPPKIPMWGDTVYRNSYQIRVVRSPRKPYKPQKSCLTYDSKMETSTIYRKSYVPFNGEPRKEIRPKGDGICKSDAKFANDTVNRTSYVKYEHPCPAKLIVPCSRAFKNDGPMDCVTVQKQDYVPKKTEKRKSCKPDHIISDRQIPVSDETTNRMSYVTHDLSTTRSSCLRKPDCIFNTSADFEKDTIHKLSYQPISIIEFPPAKLQTPKENWYTNSSAHMDGRTINSLSYQTPGKYLPCPPQEPNDYSCIENVLSSPCLCNCREKL